MSSLRVLTALALATSGALVGCERPVATLPAAPQAAAFAPTAEAAPVSTASAPPAPRPRPPRAGAVMQEADPTRLAAWPLRADAPPETRALALRRLAEVDGSQAVALAIRLLEDEAPLVRSNAAALLARSREPTAAAALAQADPRLQALAAALRAEEGIR